MSIFCKVDHELNRLEESLKVLIIFIALFIPGKEMQSMPKPKLKLRSTTFPSGLIINYTPR